MVVGIKVSTLSSLIGSLATVKVVREVEFERSGRVVVELCPASTHS